MCETHFFLGAHTLGVSRVHSKQGNMTKTPTVFDNEYYKEILLGHGFFPSDNSLLNNVETKAIVEEYAKNQTTFFEAWKPAFIKMSLMGVPL